MFEVLTCIAVDHSLPFLAAAVVVCILGAHLTMRLYSRARRAFGLQRATWLSMTGIIGGSSIWTTHFVAMLGYQTGLVVGYEPLVTLASLATAIFATTAGFAIASWQDRGALVEVGGAIVGLGIVLMHYMGMSAYQVQAHMVWDPAYVWASLVLGAVFGALATNRIARPLTRHCKYGGGLALVLAIVSAHFTGMTALSVIPDSGALVPANVLPEGMMMVVVVVVSLVMMAMGAATYTIDQQTTRAAVERYRHLSLHDALTGLPNRAAFLEHLTRLIGRANEASDRIAILSFDLDRFKEINDVHGHAAGDHVLRRISERMSDVLREGEFVARIGGDEFVAVTARYFTRSDAASLAQRLIAEINRPIEWNGQSFLVGSSVGVAVYPDGSSTMDDLLAQADVAMYRAKSSGTNNVCFYDVSMDQSARERSALAMDMRNGLRQGEFQLYYQQQNDVKSGDIVGFEVLLRWNHPTRGLVSPNEFVPIAEKTGFILELGDWVLVEACREAAKWNNPLGIAVNVAPQQLASSNLPARVLEILLETGLPASRLELEITESGIIADQQHALTVIRKLKALGVRIAMDDYGTGYSSLSTLQLFPFDKIKIDRSFVDGVTTNRQSAAIVRSTLILASSLDIPVLAEGVERAEHMKFLTDEGCQQVQGYFFSQPVPRSLIEAIVSMAPAESDGPVILDVIPDKPMPLRLVNQR